ncbi:hypothetical protein C5D07_01780 [Rathayibacter tritici]|uniref:hypothetical protein n=1 Tax=Rathayibacter tritici TaxID=33888 RepID=UPI000CE75105|nr:hypothetical protein [Rathayibacter tritici]PPF29465.1 hypothetical protein C5C06_06715 [Rathayibacter tritici]PPI19490.1 hypothetical protein C5D07_01780 [Rathayibacter tritici]
MIEPTPRGAPLRAEQDVARAGWVLDALGTLGCFDGIVPPRFEAAVRILHPSGRDPCVRSREVAEREGTDLHPLAQWNPLVGEHLGECSAPRLGLLPLDELTLIAEALAAHTATPGDCLAVLWARFGTLTGGSATVLSRSGGSDWLPEWRSDTRPTGWEHPEIAAAGTVGPPGRDGPLLPLDVWALEDTGWARVSGFADASGLSTRTPLALWPEDRAWYLASEVDVDSTLVGGSRALLDDLLLLSRTGRIEALLLPLEVDLTSTGDGVNLRLRGRGD